MGSWDAAERETTMDVAAQWAGVSGSPVAVEREIRSAAGLFPVLAVVISTRGTACSAIAAPPRVSPVRRTGESASQANPSSSCALPQENCSVTMALFRSSERGRESAAVSSTDRTVAHF